MAENTGRNAASGAIPEAEIVPPSDPARPKPVGRAVESRGISGSFSRSQRPRSRFGLLSRRGQFSSSSPVLEPLMQAIRVNNPKEDLERIRRAFEVADKHHEGQKRKSGEPYITHPIAVATILAGMGMTGTTLQAALLHDTVEDTEYSLSDLKRDFGLEVAMLVDGVTKLDKVTFGDAAQAETVRKMVVAMAKDIRVLVIKLADRLHNARTWKYVSSASAQRKARETLEIFAPLAHRLGMNTIKWELEDLSFATLHPKVHEEIVRMVSDRAPEREKYLNLVQAQIGKDLREVKIKHEITSRPKHYYSIYQKMVVRGKDFNDIHDLVGVRILVDSVRDCYAVLGALHSRWHPLPGRFKDYIAVPKYNMYQSLHTTVIGPGGRPVEVQIRTHDMHRRAEYGVAAHWKYKNQNKGVASADDDMTWLRSLVDWQQETKDPSEFLDSLRYEINAKEVFVFTPKGEVMALPAGSTPVDFAYAIHTEVGHRTIGARVNGKLVPLNSELSQGDWVEIFTSKAEGAGPSQDWQGFVKSARARNKIRQWFTKERREEAIEKGKELLTRSMRKQNLPIQRLMSHDALYGISQDLNYADIAGVYAAIGDGHISASNIIDRLLAAHGGAANVDDDLNETAISSTSKRSKFSDSGVTVKDVGDVWVKLARCCTPVPPDPITGFVTRGAGVSVHRTDCTNLEGLRSQPERLVEVEWAPTQSSVFLVEIQVEALDRKSLLSDVTRVLSENHVNILSATVHTSSDRVALSKFSFEMGDPKYLDHILGAVRKIDGVFDVYRTTDSNKRI